MIEALRPFLWSSASVEPSLHCVLRLLRGCYHHPQPFWTAADRFSPGLRDLTGGVAVSGARLAQLSSAASVYLGRYAAVMYPGLGPDSNLVRLAHLQGALFPGWRAEGTSAVARLVQEAADQTMGGLLRMVGIGQVRELPHAHQLVDVLAEIVVCLAARGGHFGSLCGGGQLGHSAHRAAGQPDRFVRHDRAPQPGADAWI